MKPGAVPRGFQLNARAESTEMFTEETIPRRWSAPIGASYSSPTVVAGRVYVTGPARRHRHRG